MIITRNPNRIAAYLEDLKAEISRVAALLTPGRPVVQIQWGGGTPTYLSPEQIADVFHHLQEHFTIAPDAEISIEIDPRNLTPEHLPTLRRLGFNRVSFGVQDFDPRVQEAVNRVQPEALTRRLVEQSRELGFHSINIDLIYGLPYQTVDSYARTLEKVIDIGPDRLAVFNYAHVPWMKKHQRVIPEAALPDTRTRLEMFKLIIERLTEAGYVYIGLDHFARPDDKLAVALRNKTLYRNFQGYNTRAGAEVFAFGITAISQLNEVYAQNVKDTRSYHERLSEGSLATAVGFRLGPDDLLRRHVITDLMCNLQILKAAVSRRFGIDFDQYFAAELADLEPFIQDGLVTVEADRILVRPEGRLVIRNIAMVFDRYLRQVDARMAGRYSRTV
ncbi:MAG: oxygen-independent coproporphyrinogen III oxidase [Calditrichaeota bacterium]|nr:MAG: oxygen-independent coproporphyrinogen III oxidase [Calditrichota bacterium]